MLTNSEIMLNDIVPFASAMEKRLLDTWQQQGRCTPNLRLIIFVGLLVVLISPMLSARLERMSNRKNCWKQAGLSWTYYNRSYKMLVWVVEVQQWILPKQLHKIWFSFTLAQLISFGATIVGWRTTYQLFCSICYGKVGGSEDLLIMTLHAIYKGG